MVFPSVKFDIRNNGDLLTMLSVQDSGHGFYGSLTPEETWSDVLSNPILGVIAKALSLLDNPKTEDNFLNSLRVSEVIINSINRIKK